MEQASDPKAKCQEMLDWLRGEELQLSKLREEVSARKERIDRGRARMHDVLREMGFEYIKLGGGVTVEAVTHFRYKKNQQVDNETLFKWLGDHSLQGVIKPTVNSSTLNKTLRDYCRGGNALDENLFECVEKKTVNVICL